MIEEAIQEIRELENLKEREINNAEREAAKIIAGVEDQIAEMRKKVIQEVEEKAQALRREMLEKGEKEAKKIEEEFHHQAQKLESIAFSRIKDIVSQLVEEMGEEYGN
jgi:vacuolar-type H+-ATPase subunit H